MTWKDISCTLKNCHRKAASDLPVLPLPVASNSGRLKWTQRKRKGAAPKCLFSDTQV